MRRFIASASVALAVLAVAGCGDGRPPRDEVRSGLITVLLENPAKPDRPTAEKIADCMLDRVYDSAHEKTLQAWAKGEQDKDEVSDNIEVFEASMECGRLAAGKR